MVMRAQGNAIVRTGLSVVGPEFNMVKFAPRSRPVTAGHRTTTVASQDRSSDCFCKLVLLATDGQYFASAGQRYGRNTDITQQS